MSQGDVKYARVLLKDKIYRNIFEAEVSHLVKFMKFAFLVCVFPGWKMVFKSFIKPEIVM